MTVQNPIPVPQTISRDKKFLKIDAIEVRCGEADMKLQAMSDANDQFREEMGLKILEMEKLDDYEDDEYDSDLYDDDGYMQWASKFASLSSSSSSSLSVEAVSCDHVQVSARTVSFYESSLKQFEFKDLCSGLISLRPENYVFVRNCVQAHAMDHDDDDDGSETNDTQFALRKKKRKRRRTICLCGLILHISWLQTISTIISPNLHCEGFFAQTVLMSIRSR